MMKFKFLGLAAIIGCALLCMSRPAQAQNSITLTSANGQTSGNSLCSTAEGCADVYTGIYYSTVNGTANTPTLCDDFNHEVTFGETWNATAINTSQLNTTNLLQTQFGATIGMVGYAEVASLVNEIFTLNNGSATFDGRTGVTGTDLSEAIWYITTPIISGMSANATALVAYVESLFGSDTTAQAQAYLNGLNLWILTPSPDNGPQEFWAPGNANITTPEGGSALLYLLLAGGACFGAMAFSSRSRLASRETA
jgi:hypothetical protein